MSQKSSSLLRLIEQGKLDGVAYEVDPIEALEVKPDALSCRIFEGMSNGMGITHPTPDNLQRDYFPLVFDDDTLLLPARPEGFIPDDERAVEIVGSEGVYLGSPRSYDVDINGFGYVFDETGHAGRFDVAVPLEKLRAFEYVGNIPLTQTYEPGTRNRVSLHRSDNWRKSNKFLIDNAQTRPLELQIVDAEQA